MESSLTYYSLPKTNNVFYLGADGSLYDCAYNKCPDSYVLSLKQTLSQRFQTKNENKMIESDEVELSQFLPTVTDFTDLTQFEQAYVDWKETLESTLNQWAAEKSLQPNCTIILPSSLGRYHFRPFVTAPIPELIEKQPLLLQQSKITNSEDPTNTDQDYNRPKSASGATPPRTSSLKQIPISFDDNPTSFTQPGSTKNKTEPWEATLLLPEPNPIHFNTFLEYEAALNKVKKNPLTLTFTFFFIKDNSSFLFLSSYSLEYF